MSNISNKMDEAIAAANRRMEQEDAFAPQSLPEVNQKPISEKNVPDNIDNLDENKMNEIFNIPEDKKQFRGNIIMTDDDISDEADEMKNEIFSAKKIDAPENSKKGLRSDISSLDELKIEDIYAVIPNIEGDDRDKVAEMLFNEISEYRNKAMKQYGWTAEEADHAAANRLVHRGKEINTKYVHDHPVTTITIDKERAEKVEFTEDEKKKLDVSRAIRLVAVENKKLNSLKVSKIPTKIDKVAFLRNIDAAIASYRVPLPVMGDYAQFVGAQSLQMATIFGDENETVVDSVTKKAQLCYDRFYGSMSLRKYDDENKIIMSYNDFINSVPYNDLEMMLYAVYVASTPEEQEIRMRCGNPSCKKSYDCSFNAKTVIQRKELPEWTQKRIDDIMTHTNNVDYLQDLSHEWKTETMYESPYTGNIYAIAQPTIAKFIDVFNYVSDDETYGLHNSLFMTILNSIYIKLDHPDENGNDYIQVTYDDDREAIKVAISQIPDRDLKILAKVYSDMMYLQTIAVGDETDLSLPLKIFPKCPHCGQDSENYLFLSHLVFLKARDLSVEMV